MYITQQLCSLLYHEALEPQAHRINVGTLNISEIYAHAVNSIKTLNIIQY